MDDARMIIMRKKYLNDLIYFSKNAKVKKHVGDEFLFFDCICKILGVGNIHLNKDFMCLYIAKDIDEFNNNIFYKNITDYSRKL